jgi:hypothetical protein
MVRTRARGGIAACAVALVWAVSGGNAVADDGDAHATPGSDSSADPDGAGDVSLDPHAADPDEGQKPGTDPAYDDDPAPDDDDKSCALIVPNGEHCPYDDDDGDDMGAAGFELFVGRAKGPELPGPVIPGGAGSAATPGPTDADVLSNFGLGSYVEGRELRFDMGLQGWAGSGAAGLGSLTAMSFHYRLGWIDPYAGLDLTLGKLWYAVTIPNQPRPSADLFYLGARGGAQIFLTPELTVGAYAEKGLAGTFPVSEVGLTMGFNGDFD